MGPGPRFPLNNQDLRTAAEISISGSSQEVPQLRFNRCRDAQLVGRWTVSAAFVFIWRVMRTTPSGAHSLFLALHSGTTFDLV